MSAEQALQYVHEVNYPGWTFPAGSVLTRVWKDGEVYVFEPPLTFGRDGRPDPAWRPAGGR